MASEPGQEPGGSSDENIAAVLRKVIALSDKVTVIYRDKEGKEIGHTVTENHVVEEQEGCDPRDSKIDSVEIQSGSKNWKFNHQDLTDLRESY